MEHLFQSTLIDVRSPSEYRKGHIPGSISIPLFSDEERALVGTCYKKQGKEEAIRLGLEIVGPKLSQIVSQADRLASKEFHLYCWRGGMRSSSVAWLLQMAGYSPTTLQGGYKSFRRWVLGELQKRFCFIVIGGLTGSGKTSILQQLKLRNEQVINLEQMANHLGSSFGRMGVQPSNEHFTNLLAAELSQLDPNRPIWIEDESRSIGSCQIPNPIFEQMCQAPFIWLEDSHENRIARLAETYGTNPKESLIQSTKMLVKRLGGARCQQVIDHILNDQLPLAIALILEYYDKTYTFSAKKHHPECLLKIQNGPGCIEQLLTKCGRCQHVG